MDDGTSTSDVNSLTVEIPIYSVCFKLPPTETLDWMWLTHARSCPRRLKLRTTRNSTSLCGLAFFFLTDWPREAVWLAPERRQWIEQTLEAEKPPGTQAMTMGQALWSRTVLLLASLTFIVLYCFAFWFPTMLKRQSGLSDIRVGLLGAVPYAVTFVAMQVNGWHSDKGGERRWHSTIPLLIASAGSLGLIFQLHSLPLSIVLFSMVGMAFAYLPTFWAIPTEILSQSAAAAAVGMVNTVGSAAGFAGPYLFGYLNTRTGSFSYGLALMTVSALAGGLLILCTPRSACTLVR